MSDAAHHARRSRKLMGVVLAAVVALVVPLTVVGSAQGAPGGGGGKPAGGGSTSGGNATAIEFTRILDDGTTLPLTPGSSGLAYVVAGEAFTIALTFVDKQGRPAALSNSDTIRVNVLHGTTPLGYEDVPAGETTAEVDASAIGNPALDVSLTAEAATSPKGISGQSTPFDVLIDSKNLGTNASAVSVGGGDQGTDGDCDPTPALPVCGDLLANTDFDSTQSVLLSQGCLNQNACASSRTYIQALAKFKDQVPATLLPEPATLVMQCDKSVCGGGAIKNEGLKVTLSSDPASEFFETDVIAPACPAKGVVAYTPALPYGPTNRPFCVDYVQSSRDIAGDTLLHLLFVVDAKVRFS